MMRATLTVVLLISAACLNSGCGMSQGALLYMMGFGSRETVEAQFNLTKEPVLILVDDFGESVDWPPAPNYLVDELGKRLIEQKGANRIVPNKTLQNLRRSRGDFSELPAQKIGRLCGADQVIWLEVDSYFGSEEFYEPTHAAWFAVTVKVLDVQEQEDKTRVRLWPNGPNGHYVSVSLDGSKVSELKTRDKIAKELSTQLATSITKLFTDYVPGDFEE
ncbi:MAG: hypothetical protein ACPGXK_03505 [Phycisphaerae bacterium]